MSHSSKTLIATGYVPLYMGEHRTHVECLDLAPRLLSMPLDFEVFEWTLDQCWLYDFVQRLPFKVSVSDTDHPWHKRLAMHCVIHQATEWMAMAAKQDTEHDVFMFLDYTIFKFAPVTEDILLRFVERTQYEQGIAAPGEWPIQTNHDDQVPNWRFGGTHIIAHRRWVERLDQAVKEEAARHILETGNVSWQINTWARVEQRCTDLPIRQYYAPFDERLFESYEPLTESNTGSEGITAK